MARREQAADGSGAERSVVEERLAAILDHAADAIIVANDRGLIENVNLATSRLFGWDQQTLAGQPLEVLMGGADQGAHRAHMERYLSTGRSGILNVGPRQLQGLRRNGVLFPIELSIGEAWIGGERKFIGACRDITDRIQTENALAETVGELKRTVEELQASSILLERERCQSIALARVAEAAQLEAEAANLAKSRFLANMSHEIRTPLNGVIAIADVLAGRVTAPDERELVGIIRESGGSLLVLLNEILDLARIEAGAITLSGAPFSLEEMVESLAVSWRFPASAKGLELNAGVVQLPTVIGDQGRLRQVISNLLSNAIKFTEKGTVSIQCECEEIADNRVMIELTVSDTGQGFAPEFAQAIFEPFVQADSTDTRRHGGAGLGLAICRELIELMGGDIRAESKQGVGTKMTLHLVLPLGAAESAAAGDNVFQLMRTAHAAAGARPRVLVAEDHPLNQRIMSILLDELGVEYEVVADGAAAVEAAATGRFDLVLMDLQMPKMGGLEATQAIRLLPGEARRVPVIAVTADVMTKHVDRCEAAGMDDFLAKPIQAAQLQRLLAKHLSRRSERWVAC